MNQIQRLLDLGAESVAGDVILNRKVVARVHGTQVILTDEGRAALDETHVPERVESKSRAKRMKVQKDAAEDIVATPVAEPEIDTTSLDDLLSQD